MHKQRTLFNVIKTCLLWIFFYKFVVESKNCFALWDKKRKSHWRNMIDYFYSAIHKVAGLPATTFPTPKNRRIYSVSEFPV